MIFTQHVLSSFLTLIILLSFFQNKEMSKNV
jgi:hypothetical protein